MFFFNDCYWNYSEIRISVCEGFHNPSTENLRKEGNIRGISILCWVLASYSPSSPEINFSNQNLRKSRSKSSLISSNFTWFLCCFWPNNWYCIAILITKFEFSLTQSFTTQNCMHILKQSTQIVKPRSLIP